MNRSMRALGRRGLRATRDSALLLLAALALGTLAHPQDAPGPPIGVAGLPGFTSESRITFAASGDVPHALSVEYLYHDRTRWNLRAVGEIATRTLYYRLGDSIWLVPAGSASSIPFGGLDRDATVLQMELRRAAMTFPADFDWTEAENGVRTATVRRVHADESPIVGVLTAHVDESGRATRLTAADPGGFELETLAIDARQTLDGREWPKELRLLQGDVLVWREVVESVRTRISRVDDYFRPVDRRSVARTNLEVLSVDLRAIVFRSYELPDETDWDTALASADRWIEQAREELAATGLEVDPVPSFELDAEGRATRAIVRLVDFPSENPAGTPRWCRLAERPGLAMVVESTAAVDAGALGTLARAVPAGAEGGTAYCRVLRTPGATSVQLYLPLERAGAAEK